MTAADFQLRLLAELRDRRLLGSPDANAACAARAGAVGDAILADVEEIVGARATRRALATRRGPAWADTYRFVAGYGALMTEFLTAPVALPPADRVRVARLGAIANVIVSHFDELVDGGWSRAALLPRWALALSRLAPGRALLRAGASAAPHQTRLIVRLVAEYFRGVESLPFAVRHAAARVALGRAVSDMYEEEALTPRECEHLHGSAARQKKTALPLVVLGMAAWLASPSCTAHAWARHRRWLVRVGKFIRWIDDAADLDADGVAGASNLVRHALRRHSTRPHAADSLAAGIARRGQRVVDEWQALSEERASDECRAVLETVLAAWTASTIQPRLGP